MNLISLRRTTVPTEVTHDNIQPTIDLSMGVYGRDLGHISDDVTKVIDKFGVKLPDGNWQPYDPVVQPQGDSSKGPRSYSAASIPECRTPSATSGSD